MSEQATMSVDMGAGLIFTAKDVWRADGQPQTLWEGTIHVPPMRADLGPNQLAWLRANISTFKQCEAQAQAMIAEAAAARKALGL